MARLGPQALSYTLCLSGSEPNINLRSALVQQLSVTSLLNQRLHYFFYNYNIYIFSDLV